MNITTPAGNKIRSQSQRRYVVLADQVTRDSNEPTGARIVKRSDDLGTARKAAAARGPVQYDVAHVTRFVVIDTVTGEVDR